MLRRAGRLCGAVVVVLLLLLVSSGLSSYLALQSSTHNLEGLQEDSCRSLWCHLLPAYRKGTLTEPAQQNKTPAASTPTTFFFTTNYASPYLGATVIEYPPTCQDAKAILSDKAENYMLCPCNTPRKQVVLQLIREVTVQRVELRNVEHFSSGVKRFALLGSRTYPTPEWSVLGHFTAENRRGRQSFTGLLPHSPVRFLKFQWVTSHGSEPWCTLTSLAVYGADTLDTLTAVDVSDASFTEDEVKEVDPQSHGGSTVPSVDKEEESGEARDADAQSRELWLMDQLAQMVAQQEGVVCTTNGSQTTPPQPDAAASAAAAAVAAAAAASAHRATLEQAWLACKASYAALVLEREAQRLPSTFFSPDACRADFYAYRFGQHWPNASMQQSVLTGRTPRTFPLPLSLLESRDERHRTVAYREEACMQGQSWLPPAYPCRAAFEAWKSASADAERALAVPPSPSSSVTPPVTSSTSPTTTTPTRKKTIKPPLLHAALRQVARYQGLSAQQIERKLDQERDAIHQLNRTQSALNTLAQSFSILQSNNRRLHERLQQTEAELGNLLQAHREMKDHQQNKGWLGSAGAAVLLSTASIVISLLCGLMASGVQPPLSRSLLQRRKAKRSGDNPLLPQNSPRGASQQRNAEDEDLGSWSLSRFGAYPLRIFASPRTSTTAAAVTHFDSSCSDDLLAVGSPTSAVLHNRLGLPTIVHEQPPAEDSTPAEGKRSE